MNNTIKGILIVVAITSMLVVGLSMIPIMQNASARSTNSNTNTNTATSDSDSTATADNTNNINNAASSAQSQEQSACAVAVTCPEGNAQVGQSNRPIQSAAGQFSLGALTNKWWDWVFSLDIARLGGNPILDKTGALCDAGLQPN